VAVTEAGDAYSWGWGEAGRLGIGEVGKTLVPTKIEHYLGARPDKGAKAMGKHPQRSDGGSLGAEQALIPRGVSTCAPFVLSQVSRRW